MPKLLFTPIEHTVGENSDTFITAQKNGEPALCIKCDEVAAFIIRQMHPLRKSRAEIAALVANEFNCTPGEATDAVSTVIDALRA